MKLNWGYKIAIFYILFVVGIVFLVFKASNQKVDLVTADYYGEEVRYQERIDETKNARSLSAPVTITLIHDVLNIEFPKELNGREITGELLIYCPSDEKKDILRNIKTNNNIARITLPEQNKGFHQLKLKFRANGVGYYFEQDLTIN